MRLLSTIISSGGTLETAEFHDQNRPPYAILSHTWGEDEILFADLKTPDVTARASFRKIQLTLDQAHRDGLQWAWVDTACINKDSSAELSEAINASKLRMPWRRRASLAECNGISVLVVPASRSLLRLSL